MRHLLERSCLPFGSNTCFYALLSGLVKNLALMTHITTDQDEAPLARYEVNERPLGQVNF